MALNSLNLESQLCGSGTENPRHLKGTMSEEGDSLFCHGKLHAPPFHPGTSRPTDDLAHSNDIEPFPGVPVKPARAGLGFPGIMLRQNDTLCYRRTERDAIERVGRAILQNRVQRADSSCSGSS